MKLAARDRLASALGRRSAHPAFAATTEVDPATLVVRVDGVGTIGFPVSPAQARTLRAVGQPARYGRGEQTLTNAAVRDTWEIPKDRVRISWNSPLEPILDAVREELGLPSTCTLRAELHSMLLYEKGQFFLPHQDSEKQDAMVGSLVVGLPSRHTGGELVVAHRGRTVVSKGSASALALVAFYADCLHEVRPVKTGSRLTLTFNLMVEGGTRHAVAEGDSAVGDVATHLREHFATPVVPLYSSAPAVAPNRLIYLLDHEYTERGLSWDLLKGADAERAALLRAAAEQIDGRIMLALTEIHETWDAHPESDGYGNWDDDDDEEADDEDGADGEYELTELIESETPLVRWIDPTGTLAEGIRLGVSDTEVCSGLATSDLTPFEERYEGYMGNYGNTLDRWYRRAALIVIPASQEFAIRAEASPAWAVAELAERARSGDVEDAQAAAVTIESFWAAAVRQRQMADVLGPAVVAADALDDAEIASMLLEPFRIESVLASHAEPLARLAQHYGGPWTAELLRGWFGTSNMYQAIYGKEAWEWYTALPALSAGLSEAGLDGRAAAHALVAASWERLSEIASKWAAAGPARRATGLAGLGRPLTEVLAAAAMCEAPQTRDKIVRHVGGLGDEATTWLVPALRIAAAPRSGVLLPEAGFDTVAADCARRLRERLARPGRGAGDWSIKVSADCVCVLCETLTAFLNSPARRVHEWPLKEQDRRHVHNRIEYAELPVGHETRRQGRPYTLVLTKKEELFGIERRARDQDEADLRWITSVWK